MGVEAVLRRCQLINPVAYYDGLIHVYKMRPWEIGQLTDMQIYDYYVRDYDKKTGAVVPAGPLKQERSKIDIEKEKQVFFSMMAMFGKMPKEEIEERWQKQLEKINGTG